MRFLCLSIIPSVWADDDVQYARLDLKRYRGPSLVLHRKPRVVMMTTLLSLRAYMTIIGATDNYDISSWQLSLFKTRFTDVIRVPRDFPLTVQVVRIVVVEVWRHDDVAVIPTGITTVSVR